VPSTHGGLVRDGKTHRDRFGLDRRDRGLALAPLTLSLGLTTLFHGIAAGAALIVPAASDLPGLWTTIVAARPTWMFPSAGWLELLARYLRERPDLTAPPSLRLVRVTAAPISAATCEELSARLGAPVLNSYSSSEAGLIATALPPPAHHKPGSVGLPIQEMRIVDTAGQDVPPGADGEILVLGPKVFAGYLDDPAANAAAFTRDGWFRTGDVGYRDEDGFLYLTGRLSEVINRGGTKISPAEIDAVLREHPAIEEAAAFALPHELLGDDVGAAVVLRDGPGLTQRELRRWMLDRLSPHKVPRRIWFVDHLPRTATGKVRRRALGERFTRAAPPQAAAAGKPSS
jgi:acyl-CoA synthetase (AMP-forming)/AMP-acid ligase II